LKKAILFFITLPFAFVFIELFRSDLYNFNNRFLIKFLFCYAIPLFFSYLFVLKNKIIYRPLELKFNKKMKLFLLFSSFLFFYFIFENIESISVIDLSIFSEKYRNSYYKGSGVFTYLLLNVFTVLVSFYILKSRKLNNWTYLGLLLVFIATFFLGLRIYLFTIFVSLIIRYFIRNKNLIHLSFFFSFLFFLLISFKIFYGGKIITESQTFFELIIKTFSRTNYSALLYNSDLNLLSQFIESILSFFTEKDLSVFKNYFYYDNSDINILYPGISKTSGIAIPLTVIIFNTTSYLSIIFFFLFFMIIIISYYKVFSSISLYSSYFWYVILITLLGCLVEDVFFLSKFFLSLLPVVMIKYVFK